MPVPGFDLPERGRRVAFGAGAVHDVGRELARLGRDRALVVCSWRRRRSEDFGHLAAGLGVTPPVFQGAEEHTPRAVVERAWEAVVENRADAVVSFGGGSTIDLAKALVYVANVGWEAFDAGREAAAADDPRLAHVAVPTTYAGAEATARLWVSQGPQKRELRGPSVLPDVVVADRDLSLALPWKPTGATGLAALAHCFEALVALDDDPEWASAAAERSAGVLARTLPTVAERSEVGPRSDLLAASYAAGAAWDEAGPGLHHRLCTALGARAGIGHGVAAAILLPHVLRQAGGPASGGERFARAIAAEGEAPGAVETLVRGLGLPRRLRDAGVFREDLEPVAEAATGREAAPREEGAELSRVALEVLSAAW